MLPPFLIKCRHCVYPRIFVDKYYFTSIHIPEKSENFKFAIQFEDERRSGSIIHNIYITYYVANKM